MPPSHHHHHHDPPPQPPPPKPNAKLLSLLLKAIIMTLITSFFFLLLGLASFLLIPLLFTSLHRHHRRRRLQTDLSDGFSPRDLKKLPQFRFWRRSELESEAECIVCLEGFKQGQWCRRLVECGHVFHRRCVDTWLVKVAACPTCRTRVRLGVEEERGVLDFGRRRWSNDYDFRVW